MLKRIPRRNHITPVLRELHLLRIYNRIIFKILLLTHKAVNNTAPEYLCDLIRLNVKSTTIRIRASFDPCLLFIQKRGCYCTFGWVPSIASLTILLQLLLSNVIKTSE